MFDLARIGDQGIEFRSCIEASGFFDKFDGNCLNSKLNKDHSPRAHDIKYLFVLSTFNLSDFYQLHNSGAVASSDNGKYVPCDVTYVVLKDGKFFVEGLEIS